MESRKSHCAPVLFLNWITFLLLWILITAALAIGDEPAGDYKIVIGIRNGGNPLANATTALDNVTLDGGNLTFHIWISEGDDPSIIHSEKFVLSNWNYSSSSTNRDMGVAAPLVGNLSIDDTSGLNSAPVNDTGEKDNLSDRKHPHTNKRSEKFWAVAVAEVVKIVNKYVFILLVCLVVGDVVYQFVNARRTDCYAGREVRPPLPADPLDS